MGAGGKFLPSGFFSTIIGNVTGKVTGRSAGTETSVVVEKLTKPSFSSDRKRDTIQMVLLMQRKENNP